MIINRKQLIALFICSLVTWSIGYGLIPLLPIYAEQLGANAAISGYYLSFVYLGITLGAFSAGWISDGFHRRKLPIIVSGLILSPITLLMGKVDKIWELILVTAMLWYLGGLLLALFSILTGLSVGEEERGKIFGILAVTMGLGMSVGGLVVGWLVNHWGYLTMFTAIATISLITPMTALFLEEKKDGRSIEENISAKRFPGLGRNFSLLFTAIILSSIMGFFAMLIRSLVMNDLHFSPLEISSTTIIAGLIVMPFPLLMGWLSDRIGRKTFLMIGYVISLLSFVLLAFSRVLWNFWLVFIGQGIATGTTGVVNALVTDLVQRQSLGRGLARISSASWIGGMIGFALAGLLLQYLGLTLTFLIGSCFGLVAIGLLLLIHVKSESVVFQGDIHD